MKITFDAFEYWQDEKFHPAKYTYEGTCDAGWQVYRNEQLFLTLGVGYVLVKSECCGICSTDMARANLPFALPQITGHELVVRQDDQFSVVDINASHLARGAVGSCEYCAGGLGHHCPERLTLGIDRLPGGFSPYVLVPQHGVHALPHNIPPSLGVIIEPFAAALHAVERMNLRHVKSIAIVGPKRLGLLLILALSLHRKQHQLDYSIEALVRQLTSAERFLQFGADDVKQVSVINQNAYDIIYDTSGSVSGFESSLKLATKAVHLKSTHGLSVGGFEQITQLVIDEITLIPLTTRLLSTFLKNSALVEQKNVAVDDSLSAVISDELVLGNVELCDFESASDEELKRKLPPKGLKKFDVVVVASLVSLNRIVSMGLVRPKGEIFWCPKSNDIPTFWVPFFEKQLMLYTSRCGDFPRAIHVMSENMAQFESLMPGYLSSRFMLSDINQAFDSARNDKTQIKSVIQHSETL